MQANRSRVMGIAMLASIAAGCGDGGWRWGTGGADPVEAAGVRDVQSESLARRDTIGQYAYLEGLRKMHVRGYGVVIGLGDRGTATCPQEVRDTIIEQLHKRPEFQRLRKRMHDWTPERLVDDADTAVVLVEGFIPAGAVERSRFDVSVTALPGTQTTSLRGGHLFPCDLSMYRMLGSRSSITGQVLGRAAGPVFLNPFSDRADAATRTAGRAGRILSGGMALESRRVRLVLFRPSYSKARGIATRINNRFPGSQQVADPTSPSFVRLTIPPEYAENPKHFLALVRHLYLPQQPGFDLHRGRELAKEMVKPGADYEAIVLAWEGIGRTVLPVISKLYSHHDKAVRYYAALAGLRLRDDYAAELIAEYAADEQSARRFDAIKALGSAYEIPRAARPLRALLDDDDSRVRTAAYEALVERIDPELGTHMVGNNNFNIDLVPSNQETLVYAKRTGSRRIAIFGDPPRCSPPLFYRHPSGELTLNAYEDADSITVLRKWPFAPRSAAPLQAEFDVIKLIELLGELPPAPDSAEITGLGVDYATILQMLYELCHSRTINARFVMEQAGVTELFGPLRPAGRPESELE